MGSHAVASAKTGVAAYLLTPTFSAKPTQTLPQLQRCHH